MRRVIILLIFFSIFPLYAETYQIKEIYGEIDKPEGLVVLGEDKGYGINDYYLFEEDLFTSFTSKAMILLVPTEIDIGTYKITLEEFSAKDSSILHSTTEFYKIDGTDLYIRLEDYEYFPSYHYGDVILVIKSNYNRYLIIEDRY